VSHPGRVLSATQRVDNFAATSGERAPRSGHYRVNRTVYATLCGTGDRVVRPNPRLLVCPQRGIGE
jgi:hypothetical protein